MSAHDNIFRTAGRWITERAYISFQDDAGNTAFLRVRRIRSIGRTGGLELIHNDELPTVSVGPFEQIEYQETGKL